MASALGVSDVNINYRASEILLRQLYKQNPMPQLEYTKYNFDFKKMKYSFEEYQSEKYFP